MPEDRCLTNSTVFCPESGAAPVAEGIQTAVSYEKKGQDGDRYLSVIVKSNSTEDMLSVWVRQSERLADQNLWTAEPMPMPTWFIGRTKGSIIHLRTTLRATAVTRPAGRLAAVIQ